MEQDFSFLSEVFNNKYEAFFRNENNKTIEKSLYALGVLLRSTHLTNKKTRPYNPKDYELITSWDLDVWMRVTWGTDDEKEDEIYEKEMEETVLPYYDYLICNAVKYNRPSWALFGLIGMMQGSLNQNQFEVRSKDDVFMPEDFIRNIKYLPLDFLKLHKNDFTYLFSYFDEREYELTIDNSGNVSISKSPE